MAYKTKYKPLDRVHVIVRRYTEEPYYVVDGVIRYIHIDNKIKYSIGWGYLIPEKYCFRSERAARKLAKKLNEEYSKQLTKEVVYEYL